MRWLAGVVSDCDSDHLLLWVTTTYDSLKRAHCRCAQVNGIVHCCIYAISHRLQLAYSARVELGYGFAGLEVECGCLYVGSVAYGLKLSLRVRSMPIAFS